MSGTRAAIGYAKAILEFSETANATELVNQDMSAIKTALTSSADLAELMVSPVIEGKAKYNVLLNVFPDVQEQTKSLFRLLLENKRFALLEAIAVKYSAIFDEKAGIETAYVTTAVALTSDLKQKVIATAATFSNKKISINNIIDPSILGGFVLRIGDQQYNASVASRLHELKREFSY